MTENRIENYPQTNTTGALTTTNCIDYGQSWWPFYGQPNVYIQPYQGWSIPAVPTECSGDIHVFPCPHCDKCRCGKAMKTKGGGI